MNPFLSSSQRTLMPPLWLRDLSPDLDQYIMSASDTEKLDVDNEEQAAVKFLSHSVVFEVLLEVIVHAVVLRLLS